MSSLLEEARAAAVLSPIVAQAVAFTRAYRENAGAHPAIREAACLRTQYPGLLSPIRDGDWLAGRQPVDRITYFGTIWWAGFAGSTPQKRSAGKQGGYCFDFDALEKHGKTDAEIRVLTELTEFWKTEYTWGKVQPALNDHLKTYARGDGQIMGGGCGFAVALDIGRLQQRGIPGLKQDVAGRRRELAAAGEETALVDALAIALDVLADTCRHYADQAEALAAGGNERLKAIAQSLRAITTRAPASFHEALQLHWLYTLISGNKHPESPRLDVALGDFLARDLDAGVLSEEQAIDMLCSLWRLYNENGDDAVCRIVVGGSRRRNEASADRFALLAMEATRRHHRVTPQLTLRFHRGQNPVLLTKAFEVLGEGCTYPMLYNDDVVLPGVAKALNVTADEAAEFHPLGCGEYMIAGRSPSLLTVVWSVPKTVEAVLYNGRNTAGQLIGPETGPIESLDTFEKFYAAFRTQCDFAADIGAKLYRHNIDRLSRHCTYLFASLLTHDCVARNRSILDGGSRYTGACIMGHGFTNAANSLTAIRTLVYEQKRLTLRQVIEATEANFEGHADVARLLAGAPKFGNDDLAADQMLAIMWRDMSTAADAAGRRAGLHFLIVSSVNPGGYGLGASCGATADGRRKGEPFAIGHAPAVGSDRAGLTALFNSVVRVDPASGGATTNFKLSGEWFKGPRPMAQQVFAAYFAKGGQQATVTVVNRGDLEAAMQTPEKYPYLLVRLGGWSARFIDLEKRVQQDILNRTLY